MPKKYTAFFGYLSRILFFLSAGTYSHHAVSSIAERSNFRCIFDVGRQKNAANLAFFVARKNCVFSRGLKPLRRKVRNKMTLLGICPEYFFRFADTYFHHAVSSIERGRIFAVFSTFDAANLAFFVARKKKMCFFRAGPSLSEEKFQKK